MQSQDMHSREYSLSHTSSNDGEKLQTRTALPSFHFLSIIIAIFSVLEIIGLISSWGAHSLEVFLMLIHLGLINILFYQFMRWGKKKVEQRKRILFVTIAFFSALLLVYLTPLGIGGGLYVFGAWIIAILLNIVVFNFTSRKPLGYHE